tara:strand:+ start:1157 stop:3496 length:2340 start_codon:yes stop_codon:yes gene_type:complete
MIFCKMNEIVLPNQLRLVMCPTPGPGVCTLNITYLVGSNSEKLGESGYTHILEHMMFKESKLFPKGMWDLERHGAEMNATTYLSRTNYYETMPTKLLCNAIQREAARMANPVFRPDALKRELRVVSNEFQRGRNNPWQVINEEMLSQAYQRANWRRSTIGTQFDRDHATCAALQAYQKQRYTPSNAIVFVTGQFDMKHTEAWVRDHFGQIPAGVKSEGLIEEPDQVGMRRFVMKGEQPIVGIGFKGPRGCTREAIALEVMSYIMNKPVNMFRPLVDAGSAFNVQSEWQRVSHPFLFTLWAAAPNPKVAEESLWRTIDNMNISNDEFNAARQALDKKWTNDVASSQKLAMELNEAAARGDWRDVFSRHQVLESLTMEDMHNLKRFFVPERATVGIMADIKTTPAVETKGYEMTKTPKLTGGLSTSSEYTTDNGRYVQSPGEIHVRLTYGDMDQGHAMFTAATLARGYSSPQRVTEAQVNTTYAIHGVRRKAEGDRFGVTVHFDGMHNLQTLHNELECPECDRVTEVKKELVSQTMSKAYVVRDVAVNALKKAVFENVAMPDELAQQIHTSSRMPLKSCRVTAVAPDKKTLKEIEKMFERGSSTPVTYTPRSSPDYNVEVPLPNKSSNFVAYGTAAEVTIPLRLAAGVLGNGFAGRLMQRVRDQCGLTYGIYAHAKDQLFMVQATFAPDLMARGIDEMSKVVKEWREKGVTEHELDVQKEMMINSRVVAFDDPMMMADILHAEHLRGETFSPEAVQAVTVAQVNQAIQSLGKCTLVKAGTF